MSTRSGVCRRNIRGWKTKLTKTEGYERILSSMLLVPPTAGEGFTPKTNGWKGGSVLLTDSKLCSRDNCGHYIRLVNDVVTCGCLSRVCVCVCVQIV